MTRQNRIENEMGFNGATPWEAWKRRVSYCQASAWDKLQWGHALGGVETARRDGGTLHIRGLQWGHALGGVETWGCSLRGRHPWGASMGPRLGRRGNKPHRGNTCTRNGVLQWGHALGGVETVPTSRC